MTEYQDKKVNNICILDGKKEKGKKIKSQTLVSNGLN
jgi:hypothetical protein